MPTAGCFFFLTFPAVRHQSASRKHTGEAASKKFIKGEAASSHEIRLPTLPFPDRDSHLTRSVCTPQGLPQRRRLGLGALPITRQPSHYWPEPRTRGYPVPHHAQFHPAQGPCTSGGPPSRRLYDSIVPFPPHDSHMPPSLSQSCLPSRERLQRRLAPVRTDGGEKGARTEPPPHRPCLASATCPQGGPCNKQDPRPWGVAWECGT